MRWLHDITDSKDRSLSKLREIVKDRKAWVCCSPWDHKETDISKQLNSKVVFSSFKYLLLATPENAELELLI